MSHKNKSKKELIEEIEELNQKIKDLESIQLSLNSRKPESMLIQYMAPMLDNAQEAIIVMQDEVHKYANKRALEIGGLSSLEELKDRHMRETTHREDYAMALQNYYKKLQGEPAKKYRYRGIDKTKRIMWLEIMGTGILWEGRPAVLNFVTDITKQVEAEEELKKSERMLRDIIDFLPDATFAIDEQGTIISWNRKMEEMTGVKSIDILGKNNLEHALPFYGERVPMLADIILQGDVETLRQYPCCTTEENFIYAEIQFQLQGKHRWLWCMASPIYDHNDRTVGAIESMRDITDIKKAEADLKDQSLHLEEANTALKVLLKHRENDRQEIEEAIINNVKHLIVPYLEKLKATSLDGRQRAYLDILEAHTAEIVSPFLTSINSRFANLTPREVQIASLVKDGKTSKEIAELLNIAVHTTNNYRKRLRKKFALSGKDKNLQVHLQSFL